MHPARPCLPWLLFAFAWTELTRADTPEILVSQGQRLEASEGKTFQGVPAQPVISTRAHEDGLVITAKLKVGMTPEEVEPLLGKFDDFAWPMLRLVRKKCRKGPCSIEVEVQVGAVNVCFAAAQDRAVRVKSIQVLPASQGVKPQPY